MNETEQNIAALINSADSGWSKAMGLHYVTVTPDEVVVQWTVAEQHLQPFGIVHGGVHCGVVESVCSIGAGISARARGHQGGVVGLENHTSFIRAVRAGVTLQCRALPVTRGRTTQVWEAKITDPEGRLVAQGSVRLLVVSESQVSGSSGT